MPLATTNLFHRIRACALASATRFRADAAMFMFARVLLAFFGAASTGERAEFERHTKHRLIAAGAASGECTCGVTHVGAIQIQTNALPEFLHHLLSETGIGATDTSLRARKTFFDAAY